MIHIEHLTTTDEYSLTDDKGRKIFATVKDNKSISLQQLKGDYKFCFINSLPETIEAIGEMIIEASKLIKK